MTLKASVLVKGEKGDWALISHILGNFSACESEWNELTTSKYNSGLLSFISSGHATLSTFQKKEARSQSNFQFTVNHLVITKGL